MKKIIIASLLGLFASFTNVSAQDFPFDSFSGGSFEAPSLPKTPPTTVSVYPSAKRVPAGDNFTLLVKIAMKPHWHIYWENPGEAGMALSIDWQNLPAGVETGKWRWSTPKYYELQGLASYVYENVAYIAIPVSLAADLPAGKLKLTGNASWLACDDNGCFPQDSKISAEIDIVSAGEAPAETPPAVFEEAEKMFPQPKTLAVSYATNTTGVSLKITRADQTPLDASSRFFPASAKFSSAAATTVPALDDGALTFSLALNEDEKIESPDELTGILLCADGTALEILPEDILREGAATPEPKFSLDLAFLGLVLLAFAGGLILNLMPCVFPVLGLKIMHFVGKAGTDKRKIARHGFVFGIGVLVSFWILAGILFALRSGGEQLGWGFQLQEPGFVYGMILLMLVFGLSMSGVFEFGASATSVGGSLTEKSGYTGSFFSGVLAVIIATPCAAPFLAPALGSALTLPLIPSFVLFTSIAFGLAAPYVILSCVPSLLKFLPKPGAWMETFKQAMAFLLYAPALYFAWVLLGQIEDPFAQRNLLISFAVIALACWIYGRWAVAWRSRLSRITGTLVALLLFVGTVFYSTGLIYGEKEDEWINWSPEAQAKALNAGKIVYIDFTARWCATCQVNKRVYSDEDLKKELDVAGVVKMRADWTNKNTTIATELQKYGRAAVPVNVFLKKGEDPVILGELFAGPSTVSEGLREISE